MLTPGIRSAALTVAAAGLAVTAAAPITAQADNDPQRDLAAVRAATAKYHNEARAIADGYLVDNECVASPDGVMGYHYVNPALLGAPMDITRPPILIYQPNGQHHRKLVAVEYFQPDDDADLATADDRPTLFGAPFNGPMPGHTPQMPVHYDLHVWIWQHNPAGDFAQWNPAGSCGK